MGIFFRKIKDFIKTKPQIYDSICARMPVSGNIECWLDQFSISKGKNVKFIQIGASDGLRWDPVRRFIIRDNWRGILVEPIPPVYNMLKENYSYLCDLNLQLVNAAVSSEDGENLKIWTCSNEFTKKLSLETKMFYLRKASADKESVMKSLGEAGREGGNLMCYDVPCVSLNSLVEKFSFHDVDLVIIDAEGHEDKIICGINFDLYRPEAVIYESHHLNGKENIVKKKFLDNGYRIDSLGGDSVAINQII